MAQRLESSFAYSGQLQVKVKIGGHMSNDLSGGTNDRRKKAWVQIFPRVKLEWTE